MDYAHDNELYPAFKSFDQGHLNVGDGHTLYFERAGNPDGIPVLYLHGGPGAGCSPSQRRYFNPDIFLVVQFDQRGAGRSTPGASTHANTTDLLVADIETLRQHLSIDRWLVAGGSWGVTLALAYGQSHPAACLGFLLRGVFLGTDVETEWFLNHMGKVFPEAYANFTNHVDGRSGQDLLEAYWTKLNDPDPQQHIPAARIWARFEIQCSALLPPRLPESTPMFDAYALSLARLEVYYFKHKFFLEPDQIIQNMDAISHLPVTIVQGRYDMVCPIMAAHRLHLAWPNSNLVIVPDAGHSGLEPGIASALVKAAKQMARQFA
ncbi:MAG: prolyl aminopeptidase [Magnetovibrio sp.]|nr:prolyl aminopeptidase [Magnetovibrio sp.]